MRIMARKAKGIKCSFCKRFGHFLFQDNEDGTVTINCPKSTFAGRKFKNSKEFLERLEVQDVCQDLWDLDVRLRPGVDYEITPNSDRFFDFVSESVFEKELYKSFWDLLDFYQNRHPSSAEPYSSQKANELYRFIDLVMETGVMKRCLDVLARDGWCQGNVRRKLYQMWFKLDRENECAFRRIFVGEVCWNRQFGHDVVLHNWIQYFKQESEENIVYNKWIGGQAPSPDASIATISFCWMCESTPRRSMFLGTSPAFEVALYTYLFFVGEKIQPNKLKFGDRPVDVVLCKENGNIRRAYPVEVIEHRKDDASGDVIKDLASILWRAIAGLYNPSKYDQEHASLMR